MRVVVLDNRTDEQAGMVPELQDNSKGRNGTACPFVFTSREDFTTGIGGGAWKLGRLTAHELTHGADMVIRQLVDPYFHEEAEQLYQASMARRQWTFAKTQEQPEKQQQEEHGRGWQETTLYAGANRDEYLGEAMNILLDLCGPEYQRVGIRGRADLAQIDPDLCTLMGRHLRLALAPPADGGPDRPAV